MIAPILVLWVCAVMGLFGWLDGCEPWQYRDQCITVDLNLTDRADMLVLPSHSQECPHWLTCIVLWHCNVSGLASALSIFCSQLQMLWLRVVRSQVSSRSMKPRKALVKTVRQTDYKKHPEGMLNELMVTLKILWSNFILVYPPTPYWTPADGQMMSGAILEHEKRS